MPSRAHPAGMALARALLLATLVLAPLAAATMAPPTLIPPNTRVYAGYGAPGMTTPPACFDDSLAGVGGACIPAPSGSLLNVDVVDSAGRRAPFQLTVQSSTRAVLSSGTHCDGISSVRVPSGGARAMVVPLDPVTAREKCNLLPSAPSGTIRYVVA